MLLDILKNMPKETLSIAATDVVRLILQVNPQSIAQPAMLWGPLGLALVAYPPSAEQRLPLLNEVWKHVSKVEDPGTYVGQSRVGIHSLAAVECCI
jgi:hypothetical protein